jgi:hypothetical protein
MATPTTFTLYDILNSGLRKIGSPEVASDDTTSISYTTAYGALKDAQFSIFGTNVFQYNTRTVLMTGNDVNASDYNTTQSPPYYGSSAAYGHMDEKQSPVPSVLTYMYNLPSDFNMLINLRTKDGLYSLPYQFSGHSMGDADYTSGDHDENVENESSIPRLFTDHSEAQLTYSFVPNLLGLGVGNSHHTAADQVKRMPEFLYDVVTTYIAQAICVQLTGSEQRADALYERYLKALSRARILEGRSSPVQDFIGDSSSRLLDSHRRYGKI